MPLSFGPDLELLPVPAATREAVAALVDKYSQHRAEYQQKAYKEAQLREEFIGPLFEAFGWDVRNLQCNAPRYREVVVEDTVEVDGGKRAPDYCFRLGEKPVFYVEVKAPSVNIREAASPAYQVRRYGWSAGLPLCLLTDFEELAVYDCRRKPSPTDTPAVARVGYLTFDQYLDALPQLYSVFSRAAIPKGFFDRFAESTRSKRGTQTVDAEFLKEIEDWRDQLARNLALRNPGLSVHDLNFAVQALVDRILFLRIAEDRKLEPYEQLRHAADRTDVYPALCELFHRADERYNSGLFDFTHDELTCSLTVDNKVLKGIIGRLYYPECPYEFSVLGADILGAVYEQFLGKVIRLTAGHRAKVEEKPEVKKAGGVYYTPTYIVDYIVKHTVGECLGSAAETPRPRRPLLRVLDPACGSGSFLLGAYQYLLDWHLEHYLAHDPAKLASGKNPVLVSDGQGGYRLSQAERKRLLLDHIFGVDIDPQAVEVAKLNLLLKCLEGETETSLQGQLVRERALPNIDGNIKCGNSLIGPDYFTGRLNYDEDEYRRVNPFDWQAEFPDIMKSGGFDCVIGNPPYINLKRGFLSEEEKAYFADHYRTAIGQYDAFALFMELSLNVLRKGGYHAFIVPKPVLASENYEPVRKLFLNEGLLRVADCLSPFEGVGVEGVVLVVNKGKGPNGLLNWDRVRSSSVVDTLGQVTTKAVTAMPFSVLSYLLTTENEPLFRRVMSRNVPLREVACALTRGIEAGKAAEAITYQSSRRGKRLLRGEDVTRFQAEWRGLYYKVTDGNRAEWKDEGIYETDAKVLIRRVADRVIATVDSDRSWVLNTLYCLVPASPYDACYLTGCLNSQLISYLFRVMFLADDKLFPYVRISQLERLPIRPIDFSDPADVARHDQMVALVQKMLELHRRLPAAKTPRERERLQRQIANTDGAIDALVYELYGLTEEEIAIVEGKK